MTLQCLMWPCGLLPQKLEVSPAYLRNDGNEYLHYTDDWYILDSQPDKYVVIYYRGNNDAWKGYGGATIYTRCEDASRGFCVMHVLLFATECNAGC